MTDYFYCLEVEGFGSFSIKYSNKEHVYLDKIHFSVSRLLNDGFMQKIEQIFKNVLSDVKIIHLYYLEFFFEKKFSYLVIEFSTELYEIIKNIIHSKKESNELLRRFDISNEIIGISYYITDIFVNHSIGQYLEQTIINGIKKEGLKYIPNVSFKLEKYPFILEISSQYDLYYEDLLKSGIKLFFDKNFPNLLERIPINIFKITFNFIIGKSEGDSLKQLCKDLLYNLSFEIGILYSNLIRGLDHFKKNLSNYDKSIQSYDQKILKNLEDYLRDLKRVLYDYLPLLFIRGFDEIIFNYDAHPERVKSAVQQYGSYLEDIIQYRKIIILDFERLREELKITIGKINQLKFLKSDLIKRFTRSELEDKLKNLKNESEFQDILKIILNDLGFSDIKINCGRRGHKEFGKDIVFSHRNKFKTQEWDAIVVKIGKIDQPEGRKLYKYVQEIVLQGSEALDIPYEDDKGINFRITRIFIATNDKITDSAKKTIRRKLEGNVFFIDRNTILDLL